MEHRTELGDESGMTLVEMMISVAIFALVMTFTLTAVTSAWRAQRSVDRRQENLVQARTIMNNLTKSIRTATRLSPTASPFTIARDTEVQFYANLSPTSGARELHLFVDAGNRLVQQTRDAPYTGGWTNQYLGTDVQTTPPLFVYYDAAGNAIPTPLSSASMVNVKAVGITLSIRGPATIHAPATTLVGRVRLPNVDYNPLATA